MSAQLPTVRDFAAPRPGSEAAYEGYLAVRRRRIGLPEDRVLRRLAGRRVLVTGAGGCIGSEVLLQLARYGPARVTGVSLEELPSDGLTEHVRLDLRDGPALDALLRRVRPDVVFHLAAQRDPGLAEQAVWLTVTTNVLATRNLARACARTGVEQLVYASTGKALRPYTTDVYAASKRLGECVLADEAARGRLPAAAARFTHVVDNAIVLDRFRRWCRAGEPLRLHDADTTFYVQSARESAQLLLAASLAPLDDRLRVHAIRDLGWPVSVLDLAHGVIAEQRSRVPVLEIGHEPGYEKSPYPGLYDPRYSGDVSPLINGMEARETEPSASPDVDAVPVALLTTGRLYERLEALDALCARTRDESAVRGGFDALARELLGRLVAGAPAEQLRRMARRTEPHRPRMTEEQLRLDDAVRERAHGAGTPDGSAV